MTAIIDIIGREILDSRGYPPVEAEVTLNGGYKGRASVPAGASKGSHEAVELRDGGGKYQGRGVSKAVETINGEIFDALSGLDATDQLSVDRTMISLDGTDDKSRLGANALLGVWLATAMAACSALGLHLYRYVGGVHANVLPVPMMNLLNGGVHPDNNLDVQEFMIVPVGARTFAESMHFGFCVKSALGEQLSEKGLSTNTGDEGGYAPAIDSTSEALDFLLRAIESAGFQPGKDVALAIDMAASELFDSGTYHFSGEKKTFSSSELITWYKELVKLYPIVSIEDGMDEDDWEGWKELTQAIGSTVQLVGDDLFATNSKRLEMGVNHGAANALLVKLNQIGTLSEALSATHQAHGSSYRAIMSHRSGETEDVTIADIAVATNCGQIKTGGLGGSERLAKYNQLLRLEEELGSNARYNGQFEL